MPQNSSSPTPPPGLLQALGEFDHYLIAGHSHPDGDCIASQLALGSFLKRRGKGVTLLSPGPFRRPELSPWRQDFREAVPRRSDLPKRTASIVVDASALERTGDLAEDLSRYPLVVIDHHTAGNPFGKVRYVQPQSPSTTLLIQQIIEALGEKPTREEAEHLFFGFCTDTGFFRHLTPTDFPVFPLISRLVEAGAAPRQGYYQMNGGRTLASRKLLARLIDRAESHFEGRLIFTWEKGEDRRNFGCEDRDSDRLYELLLTIEGCDGVCALREESPGSFSVGLRSLNCVDVGQLAGLFGGGGHQRAAGCLIKAESMDLVKDQLLQAWGSLLKG